MKFINDFLPDFYKRITNQCSYELRCKILRVGSATDQISSALDLEYDRE